LSAALLINVKPITAQEKFYFPRANASLARAQALLWYEIGKGLEKNMHSKGKR
jgi:hypothetical protein